MKDYYLLVGLNSKDIKILDVIQKGNGLIEVIIEKEKNNFLFLITLFFINVYYLGFTSNCSYLFLNI